MEKILTKDGLIKILDEFGRNVCRAAGSADYSECQKTMERREEFDSVSMAAHEALVLHGQDVETGLSQQVPEGAVRVESDLSKEKIVEAIEAWESHNENPGGRPSKTEAWAEKIESGNATLEEAEEALPQSTFYKMKREYDL